MAADYKKITMDGLWGNNPALVQLLGLCPLLAVTGTVVNAIGLGIASTLVLLGSNLTVSAFRKFVPESVRLPIFVMIIASFVTAIELLMKAFTYELYLILGIFIPLIVTNCAIMGRADAFACKNPVKESLLDGLMMGLGFTAVLVILGAMREALGLGTLFTDMHLLFGPIAENWKITLVDDYTGFLFAILPPGAFVGMGLLIALKNLFDMRMQQRKAEQEPDPGSRPERVRITG
ncbi:electron transport complex subunit E [Neptuniibacter caesariensis]|uniref:Ion-translocating oxidoreductase complex subunit E n=1 Tax=Neptuniibacter caesariensis TaxID=207954 RepID=A0A7U8C6F1_NEPCE|nr:electron transport complex subunit E [Neptuniibacter caesariensis]EAR62433.1 NADH-ubiquinone oxidoreductase [Oceanospirillum sp. MED92] [Neptuniibacter caesariensis]